MTQPPGLLQALAPIAARRPVHIIVSGTETMLHVVLQPVQLDAKEGADIARGFSVDATPAELDADLPGLISERWVPAHRGLQTVIDQVTAVTESARQSTVRQHRDRGKSTSRSAGAAAAPGTPAVEGTAASPPQIEMDSGATGHPAHEAEPVPTVDLPVPVDARASDEAPHTPVETPVSVQPAADVVSGLFD